MVGDFNNTKIVVFFSGSDPYVDEQELCRVAYQLTLARIKDEH
jgi:hypothetical protein